jgi:lantibiotic biosynthesis protein
MKNKIELFPYLLTRTAAGYTAEFKKMELRNTKNILKQIQKKTTFNKKIQTQISSELFKLIPTVKNKKIRHTLIRARRDVHNGKSISYLTKELQNGLPISIANQLQTYLNTTKKLEALHAEGKQSYKQELKKSKKIFYKLLKQSDFRNGVLLSSVSLTESLEKYLKDEHSSIETVSKLERSLIEYLSRMYTKPSPFSTFTHVGVASIDDQKNIDRMTYQSRVKLNHKLYGYFFGLLIQHGSLRKKLAIKLNETIQQDLNELVFFTNNNTDEAFQRITLTPALSILYNVLQTKSEWIYEKFIAEIMSTKQISVTREELENYLDRLLELGFVEFNLGVPANASDWDTRLSKKLLTLAETSPILNELIQTLKLLKDFSLQYEKGSTQKRKSLLQKALSLIITTSEHFKKDGGIIDKNFQKKKDHSFRHTSRTIFPYKQNLLWYEDCVLPEVSHLPFGVQDKIQLLGELLYTMEGLCTCIEDRIKMVDFFIGNYGLHAKIPVLEFYEVYFKKKNIHKSNLTLERRKSKNKWFKIFLSHIKDQLKQTEVNIAATDFPQNDLVFPKASKISFGAFFQLYRDDEQIKIVINGSTPGFGKIFSRFLYLFPENVTDKLRLLNKLTNNKQLLAESIDGSLFNGAMHPNLFSHVVYLPGNNQIVSTGKQLYIKDIYVVYDSTNNRLSLVDQNKKKELFIFDLSTQHKNTRSKLFGFLTVFEPCNHHETTVLQTKINNKTKKVINDQVTLYPRIVYENSIVLQRKTWEFIVETIPKKKPLENNWEYFQKINTWRTNYDITEEIFVNAPGTKPQYISFYNPILVELFDKIVKKDKKFLQITEMLPTTTPILQTSRKKSIKEFFAQWYL